MILKSLSFTGFKSFAEKTSIELSENLNVIVGPNGSGKSNIVDAIAWVLGTQSPGSLRTNKMEDVIFAGTEKLAEKGFSQVSIIFENILNDNNSSEISISRKLYRDGTSEYFMNGLNCRLLDVQDFLNENGIGRQQHTIISQGEIANILNSKPEEHRETLEQASGVHPFKLKKDKALKRIEAGDYEIKRAKDILREIKKQIKPLEMQAQKAKDHEDLAKELGDLKLYKKFVNNEVLEKELKDIGSRKKELSKIILSKEKEIKKCRKQKLKLKNEVGDGGKIYVVINEYTTKLQSQIDKCISIAQVANERITFKERSKTEIESNLDKNMIKLDNNILEIELSSKKIVKISIQINHQEELIIKKEKEIIDLEKMRAASKEVSEVILDKEIEYIKGQDISLKKYYKTILSDKEQWNRDKENIYLKSFNHKKYLNEIQKKNFKEVVDTFTKIINREINRSEFEYSLTNKKLEQLSTELNKKNMELSKYNLSNFAEVKEGILKQIVCLKDELEDFKNTNSKITQEMIQLKEKVSLLVDENISLKNLISSTNVYLLDAEIETLKEVSINSKNFSVLLKNSYNQIKTLVDDFLVRFGETDMELSLIDNNIDSSYDSLTVAKEEYGSISIKYSDVSGKIIQSSNFLNESIQTKTGLFQVLGLDKNTNIDIQIIKVENKLVEIGNVNYLAKDDYDGLKKRYNEMSENINDLSLAKEVLLQHINGIDKEISFRIETAFNSVSVNFSEIFKILFPGGKGALSLTNKENILESGIQISAQPRGKIVKKISLLSGGERSLAAIAFLFAIFKSYPSPFYILDEVEAALDDANLHRMLNLLEEFRDEAQFIIVTHQQQTMQVGDVLYGVTMEPGAGSRIFVKSKEQFEEIVSKGVK